jgi:hypothetical protein
MSQKGRGRTMSVLGLSPKTDHKTGPMRVTVTRVSPEGNVSRAEITADGSPRSRRWEDLILRAALEFPPPYEPAPGDAVFQVEAGDTTFLVSQRNLVGPLKELVTAVLATQEPG